MLLKSVHLVDAHSINPGRDRLSRYGVAVACAALGLALRLLLFNVLGFTVPYVTFFLGVMVSAWYGGFGPGVLTTTLSGLGAMYFLIQPNNSWKLTTWADVAGLALFMSIGVIMSWLNDALRKSQQLARERLTQMESERQWSQVTLTSIGDAVITTDARGHVTFLNPVAQSLTGWTQPEATGRPLDEIFLIFITKEVTAPLSLRERCSKVAVTLVAKA